MKEKPSEIFEGENSSLRKTYNKAVERAEDLNRLEAQRCPSEKIDSIEGILVLGKIGCIGDFLDQQAEQIEELKINKKLNNKIMKKQKCDCGKIAIYVANIPLVIFKITNKLANNWEEEKYFDDPNPKYYCKKCAEIERII